MVFIVGMIKMADFIDLKTGPFARDDHHDVDDDHPAEPAVYDPTGCSSWHRHGDSHRDPSIGPANDYTNFSKHHFLYSYWYNGKRHNPFGPTCVYKNEIENPSEWYINGEKIKDENQHVTRTWIDKKKGYFEWKNKKGELHRPTQGPFARVDNHIIDDLHSAEPAKRSAEGDYFCENGITVKK